MGKTVRKVHRKEYVNYLLVESVSTPKGPRQKTILSLRNLAPQPREKRLTSAPKVEHALSVEEPLPVEERYALVSEILMKAMKARADSRQRAVSNTPETVIVIPEREQVECPREPKTYK